MINIIKIFNVIFRFIVMFVCFFEEIGEVEVFIGEVVGCLGDGGVCNGGRLEFGKLVFGVINVGCLLGGGVGGRGVDVGVFEGGDRVVNFLLV